MAEDDLKSLKSALELINSSEKGTTLISYGPIEHHVRMKKVFCAAAGDYSDFHHCYVYKFDNDTRGIKCYIHAVEQLSIMYSGGRSNCTMSLDKDPRLRHNLLFAKANHGRLRHEDGGQKVNETEKPASTAYQLAASHCRPGGNVLILGGGAGGDAEGALFAGMNVFVVERDAKQLSAMVGRFTSLVNKFDASWKLFENSMTCLKAINPALQLVEKQTNMAEEFNDFLAWRKSAMKVPGKAEVAEPEVKKNASVDLCNQCQSAVGEDDSSCNSCQGFVHTACAMKCSAKIHVVCCEECATECCVDEVPGTQEIAENDDK